MVGKGQIEHYFIFSLASREIASTFLKFRLQIIR
jgi:hypothetical protein